jgi:hypothetical protein
MIASRPRRGPSPLLPLRYLTVAAVAFPTAAVGVVWLAPEMTGHYYHPHLVALTHVVTLGWITLTIMGATYQLVPIVLERTIWSERLARWQLAVLIVGIVGMVAHFYIGAWPGLALAAGFLAAGVVMHLLNVTLTLRGFTDWSVTARLIVLGYAGLAATTAFGIVLAVNHVWSFLPGEFFPTLHAHAHLALLGWIAPMILGVAARVYPMFLLAPEPRGWPGELQFLGLATGVPAIVVGLVGVPDLVGPGALAVALAGAAHLWWVLTMVRRRKRPVLDWGLRFMLTGAGFLLPVAVLGLALALGGLSGPQAAGAYAILALGGWISLTIAGMMLKIVPFLVWYRVYGPLAGREPVPTLAQLCWAPAEAAAYGLLTGGVVLLAGSVAAGNAAWIRLAGTVLLLGAVAFTTTLARVLWRLHSGSDRAPVLAART